jgi:protein O-GlcNAc transferase
MAELITDNLVEYEAMALRLATTPVLLAEVRGKLSRNRGSYPLFDTGRFCRHIEAAYIAMWERHLRGEPPAHFSVSALS